MLDRAGIRQQAIDETKKQATRRTRSPWRSSTADMIAKKKTG